MPENVRAALEKHSIYLVSFFGYELRDVSGISDKIFYAFWPAPGSEDTKFGVTMGPEVDHGEAKVYAGVQA